MWEAASRHRAPAPQRRYLGFAPPADASNAHRGRDLGGATHAYRHSSHCALMPASPMTFPHFAISVRKRAAHSSGVLATGS